MKKVLKKEKGITLVALVITIIILLILAGITIATLNESGLFDKSQQAKVKDSEAETTEDMKIKLMEAQIDIISSGRDSSDLTLIADYLNTNYGSNVDTTIIINYIASVTINTNGITKPSALKIEYNNYGFAVDKKGSIVERLTTSLETDEGREKFNSLTANTINTTGSTTGETTTPTTPTEPGENNPSVGMIVSAEDILNNPQGYYGREVEYSTKSDVTVASINSLENINLVADVDEELENEGIKWRIFYADKEHIYLITSDFVKVDGENYYKVFDTANETLDFMNTKSNWKEYVGNNAEYAIGGPTFTMFSNSWKSKYPEERISATGNEEKGWNIDYKCNVEDDLYFKYESNDYWLASKSTEGGRYLVHAGDGYISSFGFAYNPQYGEEANLRKIYFRPIVCLKSDIKLQAAGEGFTIVNDDKD